MTKTILAKDFVNRTLFNRTKIDVTKFQLLEHKKADTEVFNYLEETFSNLTIEVPNRNHSGYDSGSILWLMEHSFLKGWCWQTTESSIILFNEDEYIERGYLELSDYYNLYHSWICLNYKEEKYAFDPCLNILCKEDIYKETFNPEVLGTATANDVRAYLLNNTPPSNEICISGDDNIDSPMFRNSTAYKIETENSKIKKLTATYYRST